MDERHIKLIADFLTDDPDVFGEAKRPSKKSKVDKVKVKKSFNIIDGLEDKDEPADPSKKTRTDKSGLNKLTGIKAAQSKKKVI